MNLIEKVFAEMSTDADGNDKQAQIIEQEYLDATEDQQKAIDRGIYRSLWLELENINKRP